MVVAGESDLFLLLAPRYVADHWGIYLTVLGPLGHLNGRSGLGAWPAGLKLVAELGSEQAGLLP